MPLSFSRFISGYIVPSVICMHSDIRLTSS